MIMDGICTINTSLSNNNSGNEGNRGPFDSFYLCYFLSFGLSMSAEQDFTFLGMQDYPINPTNTLFYNSSRKSHTPDA